jgi:hypothetical protein
MKRYLFVFLFRVSNHLSAQRFPMDIASVTTIDGIVNEVLSIISGEKGEERNWERFRQLFLRTAQFAVLFHKDDGTKNINTLTLEEFVRLVGQSYRNGGFLEHEISKTVDEYNGIAHVFQSYYAKEPGMEEKRINSFQLIHDGKRWWIFSIMWTNDRNGVKVREKYLKIIMALKYYHTGR